MRSYTSSRANFDSSNVDMWARFPHTGNGFGLSNQKRFKHARKESVVDTQHISSGSRPNTIHIYVPRNGVRCVVGRVILPTTRKINSIS